MAVSSVVITVEGVLQKHVSYAPIPVGIALYHGLCNTFNVLLVSDTSQKEVDYWLSLEGLNKHSSVKYNEGELTLMDYEERHRRQVNSFRTDKYHVDLVIEPDPAMSVMLLNDGFNVMTFTHAQYALPEWRPDYEQKPRGWDRLQEYEKEMAELRAVHSKIKEEKDGF